MDRNEIISHPVVFELLELAAMTLASCGESGEAHAAPVYFATGQNWQLYFFSDPLSQHSTDLARDPRAAAAIYPECSGWQEIRGLQLRGTVARIARGPDWEVAWKDYVQKFPFVKNMQALVARNTFYSFHTDWLRLVDNRHRFGYKLEWTLP